MEQERERDAQHNGHCLRLYNQHMGAVELVDQCVMMYRHKKQTVVHLSVFYLFFFTSWTDCGQCLAPAWNVSGGKDGYSTFQDICNLCANKWGFHPDMHERKTQCHLTSVEMQSSVLGTSWDQVWLWRTQVPAHWSKKCQQMRWSSRHLKKRNASVCSVLWLCALGALQTFHIT